MTAKLTSTYDAVPPGPRYALDACALAHGATRGPALLLSAVPAWEHVLRLEIGDQLFAIDAPDRPVAQAWMGAIWLEPQWRSWRADLDRIARLLPDGGLLSIVLSLPVAFWQREAPAGALGVHASGLWWLRATLRRRGFKVERMFGFQTIWSSALRWVAFGLRSRRPDWSDRLRYAVGRSFATRRYRLLFAATGLIEARAGMRP